MVDRNTQPTIRLLVRLLFEGQRVDWAYSLLVILVVTSMCSTPLALGSIRNRVYTALKVQIEKENNAREIRLEFAEEGGRPLDDTLLAELRSLPEPLEAAGNRKLVVTVDGPSGADFLTLQTLDPGDPRSVPLAIEPRIPASFGTADVIISDSLGRLLFGDRWDAMWPAQGQNEAPVTPPLHLSINDIPLAAEFRVVARRTLPGRALYVSSAAGAALRRFTLGFGSELYGLPIDEGLVQAALPPVVSSQCWVFLSEEDGSCTPEAEQALIARLTAHHHEILANLGNGQPHFPGYRTLGVGLRDLVSGEAGIEYLDREAQCREIIAPQLIDHCSRAHIVDILRLDTLAHLEEAPPGQEPTLALRLIAMAKADLTLLAGHDALRDQFGSGQQESHGALALTVSLSSALPLGQRLRISAGESLVPAFVSSFYRCEEEKCATYVNPEALFRLRNLQNGTVRVASLDPLIFVPTETGATYDQILAYAPEVESVPRRVEELRLLYPKLSVQYNAAALDKLQRQDGRLSTLFWLTMVLSVVSLILALSALSYISLERRSRQIAQMLILGFQRRFVRRLVVCEYLLLTAISASVSWLLTAALFTAAQEYLLRPARGSSGRDFAVIVDSMGVDPSAFLMVFAFVVGCTWLIAMGTAWRAAKSDPLNLLD